MAAAKKKADAKPAEESAVGGEDGGEGDLNDGDNNGLVICAIVTIVFLMVLAVFDSMTTHFFKRGCIALADWTMNNAPGSFIIFEVVIIVLIVCCLPYGPLSLLSGALFYQKYGTTGVIVAWVALFIGKPPPACRNRVQGGDQAFRARASSHLAPRDSTYFFVPLSLSISRPRVVPFSLLCLMYFRCRDLHCVQRLLRPRAVLPAGNCRAAGQQKAVGEKIATAAGLLLVYCFWSTGIGKMSLFLE
jgi:hypothetical protein